MEFLADLTATAVALTASHTAVSGLLSAIGNPLTGPVGQKAEYIHGLHQTINAGLVAVGVPPKLEEKKSVLSSMTKGDVITKALDAHYALVAGKTKLEKDYGKAAAAAKKGNDTILNGLQDRLNLVADKATAATGTDYKGMLQNMSVPIAKSASIGMSLPDASLAWRTSGTEVAGVIKYIHALLNDVPNVAQCQRTTFDVASETLVFAGGSAYSKQSGLTVVDLPEAMVGPSRLLPAPVTTGIDYTVGGFRVPTGYGGDADGLIADPTVKTEIDGIYLKIAALAERTSLDGITLTTSLAKQTDLETGESVLIGKPVINVANADPLVWGLPWEGQMCPPRELTRTLETEVDTRTIVRSTVTAIYPDNDTEVVIDSDLTVPDLATLMARETHESSEPPAKVHITEKGHRGPPDGLKSFDCTVISVAYKARQLDSILNGTTALVSGKVLDVARGQYDRVAIVPGSRDALGAPGMTRRDFAYSNAVPSHISGTTGMGLLGTMSLVHEASGMPTNAQLNATGPPQDIGGYWLNSIFSQGVVDGKDYVSLGQGWTDQDGGSMKYPAINKLTRQAETHDAGAAYGRFSPLDDAPSVNAQVPLSHCRFGTALYDLRVRQLTGTHAPDETVMFFIFCDPTTSLGYVEPDCVVPGPFLARDMKALAPSMMPADDQLGNIEQTPPNSVGGEGDTSTTAGTRFGKTLAHRRSGRVGTSAGLGTNGAWGPGISGTIFQSGGGRAATVIGADTLITTATQPAPGARLIVGRPAQSAQYYEEPGSTYFSAPRSSWVMESVAAQTPSVASLSYNPVANNGRTFRAGWAYRKPLETTNFVISAWGTYGQNDFYTEPTISEYAMVKPCCATGFQTGRAEPAAAKLPDRYLSSYIGTLRQSICTMSQRPLALVPSGSVSAVVEDEKMGAVWTTVSQPLAKYRLSKANRGLGSDGIANSIGVLTVHQWLPTQYAAALPYWAAFRDKAINDLGVDPGRDPTTLLYDADAEDKLTDLYNMLLSVSNFSTK